MWDRLNRAIEAQRATWIPALCLFLCALTVRLIYLYQVRDTPLFDALLIDSETYDRFAQLILKGQFRGEEVYSVNILYPYFLALIYAVFGRSWIVVGALQAVMDAASCVLISWIAERLFDRRVGLTAGVLAAAYGPFIFFSGALLTPTVINFFLLLTLFLLLRDRDRRRWPLTAGLCLSLAVLGRGSNLLLLPAGLVFFRQAAGSWRKARRAGLAFGAGAVALLLVVTARNYAVEKRFVPIAANYGAFYSGHNASANGLYTLPSFAESAQFEGEVNGVRNAVGRKLRRPVTLAETSDYLLKEGLKHILEDPWMELKLTFTKFYFFWNTTEPPTNLNYYFAQDFSTLLRHLPLAFGIVAPLGLFGMFLARRDWRKHFILYLYVGACLATCVGFYVSTEYRLPAVPALLMFAAFALVALFDRMRPPKETGQGRGGKRRRRTAEEDWTRSPSRRTPGFAGAVLLPLFVFCNYRTDLLRGQSLKRVDYLNFGTLYTGQGRFDRARAMLDRALEIDPAFGAAYRAYAELYQKLGDAGEAARYATLAYRYGLGDQFGHGLSLDREQMAEALKANEAYQKKDYAGALRDYEELDRTFAASGDVSMQRRNRNNIGLCHYKLGQFDLAEVIFKRIIEEDSTYVTAYTNLAKVFEARNDLQEAIRVYQQALRIDPKSVSAQRGLENALIRR